VPSVVDDCVDPVVGPDDDNVAPGVVVAELPVVRLSVLYIVVADDVPTAVQKSN
jgi:hypothetical protein